MLKSFKAKSHSFLGVDLSQSAVKIIELSNQGNGLCIEGFGYEPLPTNPLDLSQEKVSSVLKGLLTKINSAAKFAAVAVPDSAVLSKTIQLVDSLNELEMEELIVLEAEKHLNYSADKINLDWAVLGPSKTTTGMLEVLLLATQEANVHQRVNLLREAGLDLKLVDIESYVLAAIGERIDPLENLSFSKTINQAELTKLLPLFLIALGLALRLSHGH